MPKIFAPEQLTRNIRFCSDGFLWSSGLAPPNDLGVELIASNDDWGDWQRTALRHSGIPPQDSRESAIGKPPNPMTLLVSAFPGNSSFLIRTCESGDVAFAEPLRQT